MTTDEHVDLLTRMEGVLADPGFQAELAQIRTKATLQTIGELERPYNWTYVAPRFSRNSAAALYALQTEALVAPQSIPDYHDRSRQLALAWESLANLAEGTDRPTALLNAALAYELAGYQANATYLAKEIFPDLRYDSSGQADAQSLVASFLQRRFVVATRLANGLLQNQPDPGLPLDVLSLILGEIVLGDGLANACRYFLSGVQSAHEEAVKLLQQAADIFDRLGAPSHAHLAYGVRSVLPVMERRSTWNQLKSLATKSEIWRRYLTLLARGSEVPHSRGVTELWPSQIKVLESGILESNDSVVVRLPTSGGKTRIAEMAIVDTLAKNPGAKCVFVAPYRALAFEVERTLGRIFNDLGYRVSTVIGSYEADEFEEFLLTTADLLVVTPEKLDLVLRVRPEISELIKLVVLDEVHVIDDSSRGIKFEFLLNRMKTKFPTSRFLVMSAVVPDSTLQAFSKWLADSSDRFVASDWRPTIQRIARFEWRGQTGFIQFENDPEVSLLRSFVPGAIRRRKYTFKHPETQRNRSREFPQATNKGDTAAELAYVFSEQGPVLVFCTQPNFVESVCRAILSKSIYYRLLEAGGTIHPHFYRPEQTRSLDLAREWLGEEHTVTQALARGIAPHHGQLPSIVREAIEIDCRAGRYRVIVATNTLAQGVNLPVKTVVIHSTRRWDMATDQPLRIPVRDYWNIAGRAGRAGQETEGLVIHLILSRTDMRDFHHYQNPNNLEPVSGALFQLLKELTSSRLSPEAMEDAAETLDPEILALAVEEGLEEGNSDQWDLGLSGTLAQLQANDQGLSIDPLFESIQLSVRGVFEQAPESSWRHVYAQTGLRSSSCATLRKFVEANQDALRQTLLSKEIPDLPLLNRLLIEASLPLPEAQITTPFTGDVEILLDLWVEGRSITEIYERIHAEAGEPVERLSRYVEELFGYRLPWIISGLFRIFKEWLSIRDEGQTLNEYIRSYPSMVKYGLPDPIATWAMSTGISGRDAALKMAQSFKQFSSVTPSHEGFVNWMASLSDDTLHFDYGVTGYALGELRYKLGRMAINPLLRPIQPLHDLLPLNAEVVGIRYGNRRIAAGRVQPQDMLELRRDYDNPVDPNAVAVYCGSGHIGFLPKDIAQRLAPDIDAGCVLTTEALETKWEDVPAITVRIRLG